MAEVKERAKQEKEEKERQERELQETLVRREGEYQVQEQQILNAVRDKFALENVVQVGCAA